MDRHVPSSSRIAYTFLHAETLFNATRESDIVQKNVIVSQKRHAQGRPRLSLSYMWICTMQPIVDTDSLLKPVSPRKYHPPRYCSALFCSCSQSIASSRGPPRCPRLPSASVPPQEPKSECCAVCQFLSLLLFLQYNHGAS